MVKFKKITALVLVLLLGVSILAGCSGASSSDQQSPDTPNVSASSPETTAVVKEQVIKWPCIWVGTDSKAPSIAELVKGFNGANEGKIKVVVEESPNYDDYRDKIRTGVVAGSFPDFFTLDQVDMNAFLASESLMDFTPMLDDTYKSGFTPGIFDTVVNDKKETKVIPYEKAIPVFIYNKELLNKVGYAEFPKTFDDLFTMFDKMKAAGIISTSQMTAANAWTSQLWFSNILVAIGGPDIFSKGLDDPAWIEAAKVMKRIFDNYTTSDAVGATATVAGGHYLNGRTAILANGTWYFGRLSNEGIPGLADNSAVAASPAYTGGKGQQGGIVGATLAFLAAAKTEDKEREAAVFEWVKFLTNPENVKNISKTSGSLFHVNVDLGEDISPLLKQTMELLNNAPYFTNHFDASMPLPVVNEFPQALSGLVTGELTPEKFVERLKTAQEKG